MRAERAGLSGEIFAALIERLRADDPCPEAAYERLRARLIAVLALHVPLEAEALADVALDRMARRLHEGTVVENAQLYALGIGRMLVLEARARAARERRAELEVAQTLADAADPRVDVEIEERAEDEQRTLAAVTECLRRLAPDAAELILAYYCGDGGERIARRRRLAKERGISLNALRNRALRLRGLLERCTRERIGGRVRRAGSDAFAANDTDSVNRED